MTQYGFTMTCKVCASKFSHVSALLKHQSDSECGKSLTSAAIASPPKASPAANAPPPALAAASSGQPSPCSALALDCEMVAVEGAAHGQEISALARVAVVDWDGRVLLDTFVKPDAKVLDHRTWVSGVCPQDLVSAPNFKAVQRQVADLIRGKIVVGHALHNDWAALKLSHPPELVRDTSDWGRMRFKYSRPPSLKFMCSSHLQLVVQGSEHSPVEDSRAAMRLYRKFSAKWEKHVRKQLKAQQPA